MANKLQKAGCQMTGCGCLLVIIGITGPVIVLLGMFLAGMGNQGGGGNVVKENNRPAPVRPNNAPHRRFK